MAEKDLPYRVEHYGLKDFFLTTLLSSISPPHPRPSDCITSGVGGYDGIGRADMMELVDMPGLGSGDHNVRGGSSPSIRTS